MSEHAGRQNTLKLLLLLLLLLGAWVFTAFDPPRRMIVWFLLFGAISVLLLLRCGPPRPIDIAIGVVLALLAAPDKWFMALFTAPAYMAAAAYMRGKKNQIPFVAKAQPLAVAASVGLGIGTGIPLGLFNLALAKALPPQKIAFTFPALFVALRAGITEEVLFRFLFFALCVVLVKDMQLSSLQRAVILLVMTVPHTLLHFSFAQFSLTSVVVLTLLFGLPFALLQRKRDLLTAIIAHFVVDLIRFMVMGTGA